MTRDHDQDQDGDEYVSKTQLKKHMAELQALGESLITLTNKQYNAIAMPDELRRAVDAARGMTKRGALHRQRQFIGRVMRNIDAEPIRAALAKIRNQDRHAARQFHRVDALRNALLGSKGDSAITGVCADYPHVDRQTLRQKLRAARREEATGKPAGAKRALFRFLDGMLREADGS